MPMHHSITKYPEFRKIHSSGINTMYVPPAEPGVVSDTAVQLAATRVTAQRKPDCAYAALALRTPLTHFTFLPNRVNAREIACTERERGPVERKVGARRGVAVVIVATISCDTCTW
ncbi:hypothetical protein J6590_040752 [Homalodisca vitripennis]|nr:hypothetical protein J6590_040752 [Homalodisca vitripennis]